MNAEPLTQAPSRPVGHPVLHQQWRDLTMLHWRVAPEVVAPLLPAGTRPDVLHGVTWVGLVPFVMTGVRVLGTSPLPWLSAFAETNVRLYAVDAQGRRAVVFRSLEASRLVPVLVARASYRLAYMWARMSVHHDGDTVSYESSRRWPGPRGAHSRVQVRIGEPCDADELSLFLTARWGLFSSWYGGTTAYAPVEHEPWRLHRAELLDLSEDLVERAGLPPVAGRPHVLWSPGVSVRIGRPRPL
ncbi:MAG: uncharacterized protein JWN35_3222 [Frankiales bacterium]|jgi:uncharacterized protein YqjF (DUF2071 family)|nr:uncharacterized protein [Frankiales bacterium]